MRIHQVHNLQTLSFFYCKKNIEDFFKKKNENNKKTYLPIVAMNGWHGGGWVYKKKGQWEELRGRRLWGIQYIYIRFTYVFFVGFKNFIFFVVVVVKLLFK